MAVRHLFLVRHGQYETDNEGDERGGGLTDTGRQQADLTAEVLSKIAVKAVYTSSMRRAFETAERVAIRHNLAPQAFDVLREAIPAVPLGLEATFAAQFKNLSLNDIQEQGARAERAYQRFFRAYDGDNDIAEVIVCHGNIVRFFACRVLGAPIDLWGKMETNHCGISHVSVDGDQQRLISLNETGHLPPDLRLFT